MVAAPPVQRDLFGEPLPAPKAPPRTAPPVARAGAPATPAVVSEADVASFRAHGAEVCVAFPEVGPVWIVPARTGQDRRELLPEQLALLVNAVAALPGSRWVELRRRSPGSSGGTRAFQAAEEAR
jgi:hypothetical protein